MSTLRAVIATILGLGISAGVLLMIELQRKVAEIDDKARANEKA